jgi:hypothetical protein
MKVIFILAAILAIALARNARFQKGACNKCAVSQDLLGVLVPVNPTYFMQQKFRALFAPRSDSQRCTTWHFSSTGLKLTYGKKGNKTPNTNDAGEEEYYSFSSNSAV